MKSITFVPKGEEVPAKTGQASYTTNGVMYEKREDAQALAAYLNKTDGDGWTYEVDPVKPDGSKAPWYKVKIFDEDGEFVAYFG